VIPDRLVEDDDTLDWQHAARRLAVPGHTPGSTAACPDTPPGAQRRGSRASVCSLPATRLPRTTAVQSSACSTPTQPRRRTASDASRA
jgi:hypothetical protein